MEAPKKKRTKKDNIADVIKIAVGYGLSHLLQLLGLS